MRRPDRKLLTLLAVGAVLTVLAAACGGASSAAEKKGSENTGDAVFTAYKDNTTKLNFQYPNSWTKTSDRPLTFSGQDEFVSVQLRPLPAGGDVLAAARADEAAVKSNAPGYKRISIAPSTEVTKSAVISYEWDITKSAVTGKPIHERADRYYIDLGNGQMAVLTGSSPSSRFDREQVRDMALTVKVTP